MNKREPLMNADYFARRLGYIDREIESRLIKLRDQPEVYKKPQSIRRSNLRERHEQLFLGYSLGEDIEQLAARLPSVVEAYEAYLACPGHTSHDLADLDRYTISLWLVSFAILLKADALLWDRLLACIGNEGKDALFESLVVTRTPRRKQTDTLLHENIFRPLFNAIFAEGESRDGFVKRYLKDWYGAFKRVYWHDSHKGPEGGGFFGYWAVEVAGMVKAFNMDDSAFRDLPYYPRDLVSR